MNISGIVTTLNEADNITACIRSLQQVCNEVIVMDSFSQDDTVSLAQAAGAKVYQHAYIGDGLQKNLSLPLTKNLWILSVDADERLTDKLVETIEHLDLVKTAYDGFAVRRRNYVGSRWLKCCHWYPDYLVRLYRKDKLQFAELKQHSYVPTTNTMRLEADLDHFRYHNIDELFAKPERNYSTRGAKILFLNGKKIGAGTPFWHGFAAFVVNYFFRGGILSGIDGYTLAKAIAHNSYMKYAKLLEYQRDESVRNREDWSSVW